MIIRATQKTLNIAGLKAYKSSPNEIVDMPGEWTAGVVSVGKPGKMAVNYVHNVTRISVLISGKSINKTNLQLSEKIKAYLIRHGYSDLIRLFELDNSIEVFASASKSVLGHMNELRKSFPYQFDRFSTSTSLDFSKVEDLYLDYPFRIKSRGNGLITTKRILEDLK